ncbi:Serine/threonine kinase PKN13 [Cystobacter fuscus DSM 2262]|uniref:Serine/threonine kinase PKN13 n=2 Tax=Cystobacter fuscus TaxID=43 RepID=S9QSC0_CYSF2|nr:Serine/threonine kinase PKN13 [Cystobacter fuscus DSM 2262]
MLPSAQDDVRGRQMGNYEVLCRLSTGGMAEIFLASRRGLAGFHKPVVLKKILPDIQGQEEFVQMFLDEARVTAAFNHPNIAQVFDLDVAGGELFLAMEFVPGATLLEVARACLAAKEPMPMGLGLAAVRDTALALHYAHTFTDALGEPSPVIHRDVAEKNIMVTYEGVTKLLDFGIAKSLMEVSRTQVGMVKGTSGYMSPEQILGQPLDARSDLFSLGVVLHECLTGARLFPGKAPAAVMNAVLRGPIPEPSRANKAVPPELDAIVLKALSRQREDRHATTLEFARELERAVSGLIWLPEQSGALLRRLFAERREQTRQVLAGARTSTGELKLPLPPADPREGAKDAAKEGAPSTPAPRLPMVTPTPPQASRGPSSANTDIVPYSPLVPPPAAPVAGGEPRAATPTPRTPARASVDRSRPVLPPPPRPRAPGRVEPPPAPEEKQAPEKTALVRPRRSTTSENRAASSAESRPASPPEAPASRAPAESRPASSEASSSRSQPTRALRTSTPDAATRASVTAPSPDGDTEDTTQPHRRPSPPPRPAIEPNEDSSEYPTLPFQTLPSLPPRSHAPKTEEELLLSSGTHSIATANSGRGLKLALLVLVVLLGLAAMIVALRWDGGAVSSWLLPSPAAQAAPPAAAPGPGSSAP